jgi:hypothetical protein
VVGASCQVRKRAPSVPHLVTHMLHLCCRSASASAGPRLSPPGARAYVRAWCSWALLRPMQGRRRSRAAAGGLERGRWGATSSSAATTRLPSPWIWRLAPPRHATTTPNAAGPRRLRRRRRLGSASSRSTCSVGSPCWYVQTTRILSLLLARSFFLVFD